MRLIFLCCVFLVSLCVEAFLVRRMPQSSSLRPQHQPSESRRQILRTIDALQLASARNDINHTLRSRAKGLLPPFIPVVATLLGAAPAALAATASSGVKVNGRSDLRAILESRSRSGQGMTLLQKLFFGVNAKGKLGQWRAGDTRTEVSMLINGLSMLAILGVWAVGAYIAQKREESMELRNLKREVLREQEYRENMYFEAVEDILKRLGEDGSNSGKKLKSSMRADLQKQLKDLDPQGTIRAFLAGKGERPVLDVAGKRAKAAGRMAGSGERGLTRAGDDGDSDDSGLHSEGAEEAGAEKEGRGQREQDMSTIGRKSISASRNGDIAQQCQEYYDVVEKGDSLFAREAGDIDSDAGRFLQAMESLDQHLSTNSRTLSASDRLRVVQHLSGRFQQVYRDRQKRRQVLGNIEERIRAGATAYWEQLASNI